MKRLLQINPVVRNNTSTGRIMCEIGSLAMDHGWESYIAYSHGRDPHPAPSRSILVPVGNRFDVAAHGLATRLFDRHGLASAAATRRFIDRIRAIDPDIIHIHNIHGYFLHYPTLFGYLAQSGKPVVWTVHDCWLYTGHCYYYSAAGCEKWVAGCGSCPQQRKFPASYIIDRSARNFTDKRRAFTSLPHGQLTIVPVSQWIRSEMNRSFLRDYSMRVIHNGIDLTTFHPYDNDTDIRSRYPAIGSRRILLGVASIWSAEKGLDDFIALSRLIDTEREVIVLVGIDSATTRRLPPGIIPINRTDNIAQLARLYSAAQAFINPTWQDNYPTVNLESIACGTPVITYRTGGSVEAITPRTGIVVEQGSVNGLLSAIHTIYHRDRHTLRTDCRRHAEANFDKQRCYAQYLTLYQNLLSPEKEL